MTSKLSRAAQRSFLHRQIQIEESYQGLSNIGDNALAEEIDTASWLCVLFYDSRCDCSAESKVFFEKTDQELKLRGIPEAECKIALVDMAKSPSVLKKHNIDAHSIPTTILFYAGKEYNRIGEELFHNTQILGIPLLQEGSAKQSLIRWINESKGQAKSSIPPRNEIDWVGLRHNP